MRIQGLSKAESAIVTNANTCSINKVLRIANKSNLHKAALIDHYVDQSKRCAPGTIGYGMAQDYLCHLLFASGDLRGMNIANIVETPQVALENDDLAGDLLQLFYNALGWNSEDYLDPKRVRVSTETHHKIFKDMQERSDDEAGLGMFMVNFGPGVEEDLPPNLVVLLEGWVTPDVSEN